MKRRTGPLACAVALLPLAALAADPGSGQASAGSDREAGEPAVAAAPAEAGPQLLTEDLRLGIGEVARSGTQLIVHYTGWLYEPRALGYRGRKFDSSRDRGQAFAFRLGEGRVIKGWEVGIPGMRVGGLRRLVIPPAMAYGDRAVGDGLIPAGSTLVFEVELLGVESTIVTENSK